jgi:peptidoglycan hydrolase-like protein with peptidoglycan-binding domain
LRTIAIFVFTAVSAFLTFAAQDGKTDAKTKTKTPPKKTTKSSTTSKKTSAGKSTAKTTTKSTKQTASAKSYRRSTQQQPTSERYKEIQQALSDKGYFAGPVDGNWGASSIDALKRFQHDQNLNEDGKLGSLSIIALGLGPRRTATP